jgi:hypothetical protein
MNDLIAKFLTDPESEEAQSWLENANEEDGRNIFEFDPDASLAMVREVYALGAVKVLAVDIDREPDMQNTNCLILELSTDPPSRASVIGWANDRATECGFEPGRDSGQSHIFVYFS